MRRAAIAALAFTAVTIESATAHHKGCDGNPVPGDQVGLLRQADEHLLNPEQISRGLNDEYIVSLEGYTFVIPADKALPSNDPCSHISSRTCGPSPAAISCAFQGRRTCTVSSRRWTSDHAPEHAWLCEADPRSD
jgi:hypothetical protein